MSSHRLEIEAGRWKKPAATPLSERKCKECNILEDEFHFICECKLYIDLRKMYIRRYFWNRPSMHKLVTLLQSTNENEIKRLAMYIFKAFEQRNEHLYRN